MVLTHKNDKKKSGEVSLQKTWQAIFSLDTDHFPLILPGVHPVAAIFILRRLKRLGYSNCRVDSSSKGLIVYAQR